MSVFPALHDEWEATRATLHAYSRGVVAISRTHGLAHPRWWHLSLKIRPTGLTTDSVSLPDGRLFSLRMDLRHHETVLETSGGDRLAFDMTAGATATEFADQVIAAVGDLGLDGDYDRDKFENAEQRAYTPEAAATFFDAAVAAAQVFRRHRASVGGDMGPVQLWPHGFDVAVEWFGTRVEQHEEHGEVSDQQSQINLGFYPGGDRPYFYSNPWPFEGDSLVGHSLPHDAEWHTEGWQGSTLPYDVLTGDPDGGTKLAEYARRVHELAAPTLTT